MHLNESAISNQLFNVVNESLYCQIFHSGIFRINMFAAILS